MKATANRRSRSTCSRSTQYICILLVIFYCFIMISYVYKVKLIGDDTTSPYSSTNIAKLGSSYFDHASPPPDDYLVKIVVVSNNSFDSLKRVLESLSRIKNPSKRIINLDIMLESASTPDILEYVYNFAWIHGDKSTNKRIRKETDLLRVSEAWYPASDNEYGILLQDTSEVSPYLMTWVEYTITSVFHKMNDRNNKVRRIIGASLYTPGETISLSAVANHQKNSPFFYQKPCLFGALYFPRAWRNFAAYMQHRLFAENDVVVSGTSIHTLSDRWARYFTEYMYLNGYFMLYPNFEHPLHIQHDHVELLGKPRLIRTEVPLRGLSNYDVEAFPYMSLEGEHVPGSAALWQTIHDYGKPSALRRGLLNSPHQVDGVQRAWYDISPYCFSSHTRACWQYAEYAKTGTYLLDMHKVTVLLSFQGDLTRFIRQLQYYTAVREDNVINTIIVSWSSALPLPQTALVNNIMVYFVTMDSVGFLVPSALILTNTVVAIDSNMRVNYEDLLLIIASFKLNKSTKNYCTSTYSGADQEYDLTLRSRSTSSIDRTQVLVTDINIIFSHQCDNDRHYSMTSFLQHDESACI